MYLIPANLVPFPPCICTIYDVIRPYNFICSQMVALKVIYHPLYSMNKFVTNKSKLPQDGARVFPYMG